MIQIDYKTIQGSFEKLSYNSYDVELYERFYARYKEIQINLDQIEETNSFPSSTHSLLPVYDDEAVGEHVAVLTRYGFMKLCLDRDYMDQFFIPLCQAVLQKSLTKEFLSSDALRVLRLCMIEFALLANIEAQMVLSKLNLIYGHANTLIEPIVMRIWPNFHDLQRFINAHEGAGIGVNADDAVSSHETALEEVRKGCKLTGWIWYIFPQMAGIPGVHSKPALKYGIKGRMEAFQYINHPVLREHLIQIASAILESPVTIYEIFGTDTMKVRACIKLFSSVSDIKELKRIMSRYNWM